MFILLVSEVLLLEVDELLAPIFGLLRVHLDFQHLLIVKDVFLGLTQSGMLVKAYAHYKYKHSSFRSFIVLRHFSDRIEPAQVTTSHKFKDLLLLWSHWFEFHLSKECGKLHFFDFRVLMEIKTDQEMLSTAFPAAVRPKFTKFYLKIWISLKYSLNCE